MNVLVYSDDEVTKAQKLFNKDPQSIKKDVEDLRAWIKEQPHLPQNADDRFLERMLLRNKFLVEETKERLEDYYTLRGRYREYFQESNADIMPKKQSLIILPLPKLTPSLHRIYLWRLERPNVDEFEYSNLVRFFNLLNEILRREDYALAETVIYDLKDETAGHFNKITVAEMRVAFELYHKAYSGKLVSLHLINVPPEAEIIIRALKMVDAPELPTDKMIFHNDLESLYQHFDKKLLPKDYGGDLESFEDLKEEWDKVFKSYVKFFDANYHNVTNENLRVKDTHEEEDLE